MTNEQIELLRLAIQQEIEVASIDGMEHGAWGWAEQMADKRWKEYCEASLDLSNQEDVGDPQAPLDPELLMGANSI